MNVLIIDDEKSIRFSLKTGIKKLKGIQVFAAESGEEGLDIIMNNKIDLAIIDIKLPGIDGIEVLERINRLKMDVTVIMITYISEVRLAVKAMKLGAYDYYTKPFNIMDVIESVENMRKFIEKKNRVDEGSETRLIGESGNISDIRRMIGRIAEKGMNTNIMITGESGTGKEVVARSIAESLGEDRQFVALNCAAIPKTLQESELFGHEKGAFTEAKSKKLGLMEKSNRGILFLDEVGDMDMSLQKKLLRAIQEKKFRRLGSTEEVEFDAMIISATNKDLKYEIKNGMFREDLYYRLNIIPIKIEPLRKRREDIPLLLEHYLQFYKSRIDTDIEGIDDAAMELLVNHDWQGNIRELRNTVERILILSGNDMIRTDDLPEDVFLKKREYANSELKEAERDIIVRTLKENNFNITHASQKLGMTRTTLRNKMKKYGIETE
ncbi:two-component system, NtrC family, nitrogen regulation response regulator NtrX [Dethiosulfatibacter aminovorans DSM 17477]|uniref:Two-component system, NtrC family, nitrogen regulation response regulator NtrX n=1 Tax=Dethiosulfatibacter aminovorans DSM 17477 TaxID=1121476 RepID=A0A1M6LSE1_9FIRM|nr:sigma-54 dependent transcriptional regulator [Dethiosulfatibacter aminovorans]SHJ74178.1 two-component system, NtrC family, nitrogen regulation response regulator NtrX [Dethiosulfatibacter aminovorans DSM 17477]